MAQKRARPTSSVEGIDGRDDAPEEGEQVFFDDDGAEHTMSDLPVLMKLRGRVWRRDAESDLVVRIFPLVDCLVFSLPFCLLVILGARVWNGDALYVRLGQPSAIPC